MTTLGNGVDIIENKRILNSIKNINFIRRIFTNEEISLARKHKNKCNYYAKRFAAKEALFKAIGTGIRNGSNFRDVTIKNDKMGKPYIILNNNIKKKIMRRFKIKNFEIFLSLSDEKKYSIAFVILNKI